MDTPSETDLKILYFDVLNGYSTMKIEGGEDAYVKHLNVFDSIDSDKEYKANLERAKGKELPTEKEQLDYLIKEDLWSHEKEREIVRLTAYLKNLGATRSKIFLEVEMDHIKNEIKETEEKIKELRFEKLKLVGVTAEKYAEKRSNEYYMRMVLYKDKDCKESYFSEEEFDDLSDEDLNQIFLEYSQYSRHLNTEGVKRLSIAAFFTTFYYLCDDNPYTFYGKPVYKLTFFQNELFAYARYFKNLSQDAKVKAPDDIRDDPNALIEFYEGSKNAQEAMEKMKEGKGAQGSGGSTVVGATEKDLQRMGYNKNEGISLSEEAKKRGGKLTMEDFAEIHGT